MNQKAISKADSQVYKKVVTKKCEDLENFSNQNLNAGRTCSKNINCKTGLCEKKVCKGFSAGTSCNNHEQCGVGLACLIASEWPYSGKC